MNTANLQLEGLYLVIASLCGAVVAKGILSREEIDAALRSAEATAVGDYRGEELRSSNREAVAFPARILRMANNGAGDSTETQPFSELAKMVGRGTSDDVEGSPDEGDGTLFYDSPNGDRWSLFTDNGGRRFVTHSANRASGGAKTTTDLEAFRQRDPNSPQNEALERLLQMGQ